MSVAAAAAAISHRLKKRNAAESSSRLPQTGPYIWINRPFLIYTQWTWHNNVIANVPTVGSIKVLFYNYFIKYYILTLPINSPGKGNDPCGTPFNESVYQNTDLEISTLWCHKGQHYITENGPENLFVLPSDATFKKGTGCRSCFFNRRL